MVTCMEKRRWNVVKKEIKLKFTHLCQLSSYNYYTVLTGSLEAFWNSCGILSIFKPQVRNKWSKYQFYLFYLFWLLSWTAPPPDLFEILSESYFIKFIILQVPQERNQGWHKQMERYTMFLDWKNQYSENDYTTQSNL